MIKLNKFAAARIKIFLVTCISGNNRIFWSWPCIILLYYIIIIIIINIIIIIYLYLSKLLLRKPLKVINLLKYTWCDVKHYIFDCDVISVLWWMKSSEKVLCLHLLSSWFSLSEDNVFSFRIQKVFLFGAFSWYVYCFWPFANLSMIINFEYLLKLHPSSWKSLHNSIPVEFFKSFLRSIFNICWKLTVFFWHFV